MRRLGIHNNIPVSDNKLMLGLRGGFIRSHLTVDKLFPVNPRAITGRPKMSLLLEANACLHCSSTQGLSLLRILMTLVGTKMYRLGGELNSVVC